MKINLETLKLLKSDVAQMEHDIHDIEHHIRSLEARRDAYKFKRDLFAEQLKKHRSVDTQASNANGQMTASAKLSFGVTASLHDAGMRDAVRSVLASSNRSLRTADIAELLLARDFQYTASTALKTRLSNELSRMAQTGHVRKMRRKGKLYFSANEGG